MKVTSIPLAALTRAERNVTVMEPSRYAALVASIKRDGCLQPILARDLGDGTFRIVDGHHRADACRDAGLDAAPAIVVTMTDAREAVERIGFNRRRGELDLSAAARELAAMADSVPADDIVLTGFSQDEIAALVRSLDKPVDEDLDALRRSLRDDDGEAERNVLSVAFKQRADLDLVRTFLAKHGRSYSTALLALNR